MDEPNSYSQSGEDRMIWEYLGRPRSGFFAEVGANDPILGSQTYLLEQMGWQGVLVEPQPACCERLRLRRPGSKVVQAACGSPAQRGRAPFYVAAINDRSSLKQPTHDPDVKLAAVEEVEILTLDDILASLGSPKLDFLSIDVEQCELDVLQGLDLKRQRPRLILVEDYVFTLAVHRHLTAAGYRLVKRTGSNNWYVPRGQRFPGDTWRERFNLFRKMYLGTPLRRAKLWLRRPRTSSG